MTVSTEVSHNEYTGNGVTTTFPYTFRILKKSDLVVQTLDTNGIITTLTMDTNYTVTGAGSYSGGSIILASALPSGWLITIDRELELVQETDLRNQGKFFAEVHENAFDYLTMLIQQCFGWTRRALLKPNFLSKYYDAKQNQISNLADPVSGQDAINLRKTNALDNDVRRYAEQLAAGVAPGSGTGSFQQFGAGAIIRTFQDKMRDTVSVKDYGADSTGVYESDAAFAYAVAYGSPVTIPDGVYKLSADVYGDFLEGTAVTYNGAGRAIPKPIGFWADQGPVRLHRFPGRVFFGNAVQYDANYVPVESSFLTSQAGYDWLERSAQMHVCHPEGGAAVVGSSRTSDKAGVVGQTCIGLSAYAWADSGPGSAWGAYVEAVRGPGVTSNIFGMELTAKNLGSDTVVTSPYNIFSQGSTIGLWLGAGGDKSLSPAAAAPSSAAIVIGKNAERWNKGIQFQSTGLVGTDGAGTGSAVAIEMARGHRIMWRHSSLLTAISGGIYSDNNSAAQATYVAFTINGLEFHGVNSDQSAEVTLMRVLPNPTAVNFLEVRAGSAGGRPNLAMSGADTNIDLQLSPKGTGIVRVASNIAPNTSNTFTCGTSALPWAGGFTQAAFTVTSDEDYKTRPLAITDAMLDAAEEVDWVQYQYLDRVEVKGQDGARWHFGAIAQRYVEAFERHGLDAHRFGFICFDEWEEHSERVQINEGVVVTKTRTAQRLVPVTKTRIVSKPVMITEMREVLVDAELEDGTKIKKVSMQEFQQPKLNQVLIFNADGSPRMDENNAQMFIYETVMEDSQEEYEDTELQDYIEEYTEPAEPEYEYIVTPAGSRYGIRYEEALALEAALQRRNKDRLQTQVNELKKRIETMEAQ